MTRENIFWQMITYLFVIFGGGTIAGMFFVTFGFNYPFYYGLGIVTAIVIFYSLFIKGK